MSEWGPWIEHDGKGCPCVGQYVQTERLKKIENWVGSSATIVDGKFTWGIARGGKSWFWENGWTRIIRYRIRKPRGLTVLENLIADLPAPVGPKVDA